MNISDTLEKRGKKYGIYTEVSSTAQRLKEVVRSAGSWKNMEDNMKESIDMICNKLARIVNGNPYYRDSWHDIAGYATLIEDDLKEDNLDWSGMTYEERKDCYNRFEVSIEAMDYIEDKLKEKNQ